MPCFPRSLVVVLLLAGLGGLAAVSWSQPPPADPFPLRRVVLPLDRVPAELQRLGVLQQLPRADFETKVRQAIEALQADQRAPRLVKAIYTAELAGQALTQGSGQWTVQHTGAGPGVLPVPQFNLALSKIKIGNSDAIFGELDGKNLGLWVEQPGTHAVYFDWSARGQSVAGDLAFDLRLPVCAFSLIELKLPADHTMALGKAAGLLTGPLDAEHPNQKLWRIQFTGRSQVDFVIRKNNETAATVRRVFATLDSRQEILAGAVQVDFDVQVDAVQHALAEVVFDHDSGMQPYEVTVRQAELKSWGPALPDAQDKSAALSVRLREPKQGVFQVRVRCLAARSVGPDWVSPALRVRGAIPRGESLRLVVPAAQPLNRWDAGQFRLLNTSTDKDGSQTLELVDLHPEAAPARRPRLTLAPLTSEVSVRQETRWNIAPDGQTLLTNIAYTARRGKGFQVGVQMPPGGWRVDEVAWEPKEGLRSWTTSGTLLVAELHNALDQRAPGKLTVRLRSPLGGNALGPRPLAIPELVPVDATQREAVYAIHVDSALQAALVSSRFAPIVPDGLKLGQETPPWFSFEYRDQPLTGVVRIEGPRALVKARFSQSFILGDEESTLSTRIEVAPAIGQPSHMDLDFSAALVGRVQVISESGAPAARLERRVGPETLGPLLLLGVRSGVPRLATLQQLPQVQNWRLRWDESLTQQATFVLHGPTLAGAVGALGQRWDFPIATAPDVDQAEGEITIRLNGRQAVRGAVRGVSGPSGEVGSQSYRWADASIAPAVTIWTKPGVAAQGLQPVFDHAQLTTYVQANGRCLQHYRFQSVIWQRADLPVILPGAVRQVLAARLDGQWLDRLSHQQGDDGMEVRLPMPLDGNGHWFDLLFETEPQDPDWPLTIAASAVAPRLPAAPLRQRQVWRLATGLMPLHQERFASLHRGQGSPAAWLRTVWHRGDALFDALTPLTVDDGRELQRHILDRAEAAQRRPGVRDAPLGEAVGRLILDGLKEQGSLLLDRTALREAGLGPATILSPGISFPAARPFWEKFGLVYVYTPAAPLLTTRERWLDWRQGNDLPERLFDAAAEAVAHGQDAEGQFCRADVWLRTEPAVVQQQGAWSPQLADWFARGWTEWTPLEIHDPDLAFVAIDAQTLRTLGLLAACVVFMLAAAARRRLAPASRLRLVILFLAAALAGLVAAPLTLAELTFWPALALILSLALDYPRFLFAARDRANRLQPSTLRRRALLVGGCVVTALLAGGWFARAQVEPPDLYTVYYAQAGPERDLVLVRPELLKRLEEARQKSAQPIQGAVLLGAVYQGKWGTAGSKLQAQFDLFSFSEKANLHVPLGGVELHEGAFLDGAPVFPTAALNKAGFVVPIPGKGWHRLILSFTVRHEVLGDQRELRYSIPPLPLSRLEWQAPLKLFNPHSVRAAGESKNAVAADQKTQELRTQIGREGQVQVRWQVQSALPRAVDHEVDEHYYWDLDPRAPQLTAILAYRPAQANLTRVDLALPESSEVRSVDVSGLGQSSGQAKWQVLTADGPRRLTVELPAAASGAFQVQVQLALRGCFEGDAVNLRLPMPLGAKPADGMLAYRLEGWDIADKTKSLGVTGQTPSAFAAAWARTGAREAVTPTRAYNFRRAAAGASLELALQPNKVQIRLDADWLVQPESADLHLQGEWTSSRTLPTLGLLLPPALKVLEVRGAQVHHWSLEGQALQVWLDKPSSHAAVTVVGTLRQPLKKQRFEVPVVRALAAQDVTTSLTIRPGPGWLIAPERLLNLVRSTGGAEQHFETTQLAYEGVFALRPASTIPAFQSLTAVELRGPRVAVTTTLLGSLARGSFPTLQVRVQDWPGATPRLEVSWPGARQEHRRQDSDHVWTVQLPTGLSRVVILKLHGFVEAGSPFALPRIALVNGQLGEQQATWPKDALTVREMRGLKEVKSAAPASRHGLLLAMAPRRPLQVWSVDDANWRCVLAAPNSELPITGQLLLAEQQVTPDGVGRWFHQADWLIQADEVRQLQAQLPSDAIPLLAQVDGQVVAWSPTAAGGLEIPLPAGGGVVHVRMNWQYPEGQETEVRPRLAAPKLTNLPAQSMQGVVFVKAGQWPRKLLEGFSQHDSARLVALAKASAAAYGVLGKSDASKTDKSALLAWQQQFLQARRFLEHQARWLNDPAAQAAAAQLRKELQASAPPDGVAMSKAADIHATAWPSAWADEGLPLFWSGTPGELVLAPIVSFPVRPWWAREPVVLAIVGVFLLSWLPHGLHWLVRLWPEQLVALVALGWMLWGGSLVALAMLSLAAMGRVLGLAGWVHRRLTSRPPTPLADTSSMPPDRK